MIGLFNDSFPPIMDGVALVTYNYAQCLNSKGVEVCVVTPDAPGEKADTPFNVFRYPSVPIPGRKPYRYGFGMLNMKLFDEISRQPYSLVHAHCPFTSGKIAQRIAQKQHVPLVATFHSKFRYDIERYVKSELIVDLILRQIMSFFESADEVWVPQEPVLETLREYGYKGKAVVVANGNDMADRYNATEQRELFRREQHIGSDEAVLLFVGQQTREKNIPFLIDSLAKVKTPFRCYFVGDGYGIEEFRRQATELGIGERCFFEGAVYERDQLASYYAGADLFVFPSLYDTWALVVREAAALYTPSLLIDESTVAKPVQPDFNGFVVPEKSDLYAAAIDRILADRSLLDTVACNARNTLSKSWDEITDIVVERYKYLIEHHKA